MTSGTGAGPRLDLRTEGPVAPCQHQGQHVDGRHLRADLQRKALLEEALQHEPELPGRRSPGRDTFDGKRSLVDPVRASRDTHRGVESSVTVRGVNQPGQGHARDVQPDSGSVCITRLRVAAGASGAASLTVAASNAGLSSAGAGLRDHDRGNRQGRDHDRGNGRSIGPLAFKEWFGSSSFGWTGALLALPE